MSLFYIGLNPRFQSYTWLPRGLNTMYSAGGFYQPSGYWRRSKFKKSMGNRFLDSGGFTLLNRYGEYPFTVYQFLNLVAFLKPHYYASLDYPCEPDISRKLGPISNRERIQKTVENTVSMIDWENHTNSQLVPVIQGYTLDEYKSCIDLYSTRGAIRNYMAVGSMCRRICNKQLHELIPGIYNHAIQAGIEKLHWFGLKLSKDLLDLSEYIYSRDSAAALDDYDSELRMQRNGRRYPKGQQEKKESFESFLNRLRILDLQFLKREAEEYES